jgi:hypothetical protein
MTETLPNWRQGCTLHRDTCEGRISAALFAINLSQTVSREEEDAGRGHLTSEQSPIAAVGVVCTWYATRPGL